MRASAALLASATSLTGLADAVVATGLASSPTALDAGARDGLGLPAVDDTALCSGVGSLRVLLLHFSGREPLREALQRLTRRLHSRAPHVLWLVAAVDAASANAGIVAWHGGDAGPRVVSFLWETTHVVDSDAETLCALSAVTGDADVVVHGRCLDVLGREGLTRRFYRALEAHVSALASSLGRSVDSRDARELALLCASRLLFVRFLEAKGWLNGEREFVAVRFAESMSAAGNFHQSVLLPLFFGTLNTPFARRAARAHAFGRIPFLNGGLFARVPLERRTGRKFFSDEQLGALLEHVLLRYRFTAREDSVSWSEASVDPEMLGRAFESLMASTERRASGVFYTPHALVSRLADHALEDVAKVRDLRALRAVRVLDPACGSGAFLVHVLERLADLRRRAGEGGSVSEIRRAVLARSVFGVDRNPTAVWLCELRLWLSVVIECDDEDPMRMSPLPNLDRNIRVGDALDGPAFASARMTLGGDRIATLRARYVRATGPRKANTARALDRLERQRAIEQVDRAIASANHVRRELNAARRAPDLFGARTRPSVQLVRELQRTREEVRRLRAERRRLDDGGALSFSFAAFFAEAHEAGGFDVIVGNPPWVRLHRIPADFRARLKQTFEVYRQAQWQSGARMARAAPGFASQVDLSALFVERSLQLLRPNGTVGLLLPSKLWRSLAGGGVRQLLANKACVSHLADVADSPHAFDAVVYPSLLVARAQTSSRARVAVSVHERDGVREWSSSIAALAFDDTPGAPWLLLDQDSRAAFDRMRSAGPPLGESLFGAPRLGVKTGCNIAFLVRRASCARGIATVVDAAGETGSLEDALLRPALRGDEVRSFRRENDVTSIVWTHDVSGAAMSHLPERARAWLQRHYGALAARADGGGAKRWWSLFRTEAADANRPRVVWADFGRRPRALVIEAGDPTVPLNTCYVLRCAESVDAWALAAILNSRVAAAWLNALAEPARGGYRRYLGWTVGQLPIPRDWAGARTQLALVAKAAAACDGDSNAADALEAAVLRAYGLDRTVGSLLDHAQCD